MKKDRIKKKILIFYNLITELFIVEENLMKSLCDEF